MTFTRYVDRARRVVLCAQDEAARGGFPYVTTGHLLVGVLAEGECIAAQVLERAGLHLIEMRDLLYRRRPTTKIHLHDSAPNIPFTGAALLIAHEEAQLESDRSDDKGKYITAEHILLALTKPGASQEPSVGSWGRCTSDALLEHFQIDVMQLRASLQEMMAAYAEGLPRMYRRAAAICVLRRNGAAPSDQPFWTALAEALGEAAGGHKPGTLYDVARALIKE